MGKNQYKNWDSWNKRITNKYGCCGITWVLSKVSFIFFLFGTYQSTSLLRTSQGNAHNKTNLLTLSINCHYHLTYQLYFLKYYHCKIFLNGKFYFLCSVSLIWTHVILLDDLKLLLPSTTSIITINQLSGIIFIRTHLPIFSELIKREIKP